MFTVPCELRLRERTGHDAAKFGDIAHVDDAPLGIKWQRPTRGAIRLFLWGHCAEQVLIIERGDHKRVVGKSSIADDPLNLRLVGKMRDADLAAADLLHVRER